MINARTLNIFSRKASAGSQVYSALPGQLSSLTFERAYTFQAPAGGRAYRALPGQLSSLTFERTGRRGSALMMVMGILFVIFIFGFGYSNYLQSQVHLLEREKEYEAASLILRSAITESLYILNYDNQIFINKIKSITPKDFIRPYEIYQAKAENSRKLMEEVFKKYGSKDLGISYEVREVIPFKDFERTGEKTLRMGIIARLNAGGLNVRHECEVLVRFAAVIFDKYEADARIIKVGPERASAMISDVRSFNTGKYYGICVYTGADAKAAREAAQKSSRFRALLVNPAGLVMVNKAFVTEGYTLTFSPPVPIPPR